MKSRRERIADYRRHQPIEELERKWRKERGRWSKLFHEDTLYHDLDYAYYAKFGKSACHLR
jgi:hypothetical protein